MIVGGNHDVNWNLVDKPDGHRKRHQTFYESFADYPIPPLHKPPETRALKTISYKNYEVEFVLLGSSELGSETYIDDKFQELLKYSKEAEKALIALYRSNRPIMTLDSVPSSRKEEE